MPRGGALGGDRSQPALSLHNPGPPYPRPACLWAAVFIFCPFLQGGEVRSWSQSRIETMKYDVRKPLRHARREQRLRALRATAQIKASLSAKPACRVQPTSKRQQIEAASEGQTRVKTDKVRRSAMCKCTRTQSERGDSLCKYRSARKARMHVNWWCKPEPASRATGHMSRARGPEPEPRARARADSQSQRTMRHERTAAIRDCAQMGPPTCLLVRYHRP